MKNRLALSAVILSVASTAFLAAFELPAVLKLDENGSFRVAEAEFYIQFYSPTWQVYDNRNWEKREVDAGRHGLNLQATLRATNLDAALSETIRPLDATTFRMGFEARFPEPTVLNALHGVFVLPARPTVLTVDGKPLPLPAEFDAVTLYQGTAREVRIPVAGGYEIAVNGVAGQALQLTIQDNRKFHNDTISVRFSGSPAGGAMTRSQLELEVNLVPVPVRLLDLSPAGTPAEPDFPESIAVNGFEFTTLHRIKHRGMVRLPDNRASGVNILHSCAAPPPPGARIGTVIAEYSGGLPERIPVYAGADWGDRAANAVAAWTSDTGSPTLYAFGFALKRPGPRRLRFEAEAEELGWTVAAVTLSDRPVHFVTLQEEPVRIVAGPEWIALDWTRRVEPGSALDFSFLADAPAGRHGFITATPEGHFSFEHAPEKRIRFYGVNLCMTANYLEKETVDRLAETFAACGYNSVRIHHHDTLLTDPDTPDSLTLAPDQLDKLDYLLFKMKQKGIYITLDLYTNRMFRPGDSIPECDFYDQRQMRILLPFSRAAMRNWQEFARRWMSHVNPYTGISWAAEPAIASLNLVNEEVLTDHWSRSAAGMKLYQTSFRAYCYDRNLPESGMSNDNPVFRRFLHELQEAVIAEQLRFVKEELGMKTVLTSLNYMNDIPLTLLRRNLDAVDNHQYFDHPNFAQVKWQAPFRYMQNSAINRMAVLPREMMPTRIPGKPFMVTEFNYCTPNRYRAEGGPLIGAYAALQDWDALYRFAWSHGAGGIEKMDPVNVFDAASDPLAQLSDRVAVALFRRGDVQPAETLYAYAVPADCFEQNLLGGFPEAFSRLGLITAIGSTPESEGETPLRTQRLTPEQAADPDAIADPELRALWQRALRDGVAASATGELLLDAKQYAFTVKTPLTESVTLPSGTRKAGVLRIADASAFQTVAAISLDGEPLASSASILVVHLTNVANDGQLFADETRKIVLETGKLPLLVQRATATVELAAGSSFEVTALSCDGSPRGRVAGEWQHGVFRFSADPGCFPGGIMAYHLTREPQGTL